MKKNTLEQFHPHYIQFKNQIRDIINDFDISGTQFVIGKRNSIKLFQLNDITLSVKSFKKPNFVNTVVYRYLRKSKAQRSFEYASKLIELEIGTPKPIAFFEKYNVIGLDQSFYLCELLENVFEYRDVIYNEDFENAEIIVRQFTQFTFEMHQKGIEFLDHSPGNTLIKKEEEGKYSFFLVDLNRMKFHKSIDFETRMDNFSRLTTNHKMIQIMSDEYAKLIGVSHSIVFNAMLKKTQKFESQFVMEKRLKRILKFWR